LINKRRTDLGGRAKGGGFTKKGEPPIQSRRGTRKLKGGGERHFGPERGGGIKRRLREEMWSSSTSRGFFSIGGWNEYSKATLQLKVKPP